MLEFSNGGYLVQSEDELPDISGETLYMDLETSSGDETEDSFNPWHHCYVAGFAITFDKNPHAWYIPVGHHTGRNLDPNVVQEWLIHVLRNVKRWVNHNVKYDCQVTNVAFGIDVKCELIDTVTQAKLLNSDRFHYSLDALCLDWLAEDIRRYEAALQPYLHKNKDYGHIPPDVCGEYACQDVLSNRRLHHYIDARMPEECRRVSRIEIETTSVLVDIERNGLRVNPQKLAITQLLTMQKLIVIAQELQELIGYPIQANVNADCFDVLCNKYGLPVLAYTDSGNPSFDKEALKAYKTLPGAPVKILDLMLEYRRLSVFNNTFVTAYRNLHVDGLLHSSYNQTVRTGRMSCKMPNAQQLMSEAKELIECDEDEVIISADYSQIEFRLIVHYIRDPAAIDAYQKDPNTDFHNWVKDMCSIKRKPAKTINFLMGYGGGKEKLLSALMQEVDLVGHILEEVERQVKAGKIKQQDAVAVFNLMARQRALDVFTLYHDSLPGLRRTTKEATNTILRRGYIRNLYGRHRHLSREWAHRAFNNICQGSAADMMKERLVALHKWLLSTGLPVHIIGVIHDEVLLRAKKECVTSELLNSISWILENVQVDLRVPIRTSVGLSSKNWLDASGQSKTLDFDRKNSAFLLGGTFPSTSTI